MSEQYHEDDLPEAEIKYSRDRSSSYACILVIRCIHSIDTNTSLKLLTRIVEKIYNQSDDIYVR